MKSGKAAGTSNRVSIATTDFSDIRPVLYSFRVIGGGSGPGSVMTAIRPPYWLYHDHALGVIWTLFHKDKNYIGITQLHWCLRFLLDLKNSQGEYTGDVEICIRVIQDDLIEQYAKLGTAMDDSVDESKSSRGGKAVSEITEPANNSSGAEETAQMAEGSKENDEKRHSIVIQQGDDLVNSTMRESIDSPRGLQGERDEENISAIVPQETTETSASIEKDEPRSSRTSGQNETKEQYEEHCSPVMCQTSAQREEKDEGMLSLTYNEMIKSGLTPCAERASIVDLPEESGFFDAPSNKTFDELQHVPDRDKTDLAAMSTKEMVNFLNSSRQQHIERIKKEIERLYGLEKFMENLNANEFSAYVTEDLARRLETLRNEDIVKNAGDITRGKQ